MHAKAGFRVFMILVISFFSISLVWSQVTILEFGSRCTPCQIMKGVVKSVEKKYGSQILVQFVDTSDHQQKKLQPRYNVSAVPALVFLDEQGNEFGRLYGIQPAARIEKVLLKGGITNGTADKSF